MSDCCYISYGNIRTDTRMFLKFKQALAKEPWVRLHHLWNGGDIYQDSGMFHSWCTHKLGNTGLHNALNGARKQWVCHFLCDHYRACRQLCTSLSLWIYPVRVSWKGGKGWFNQGFQEKASHHIQNRCSHLRANYDKKLTLNLIVIWGIPVQNFTIRNIPCC